MKSALLLLFVAVTMQSGFAWLSPPLATSIVKKLYRHSRIATTESETVNYKEEELDSKEIQRLKKKLDDTFSQIDMVQNLIESEKKNIEELDKEYGPEVQRIKKEFARIKERTLQESTDIVNKAKIDAVKEMLLVADNYLRAKQAIKAENEKEQLILAEYEAIFQKFMEIIESFGVQRVESVGKPFDPYFMEAIMTEPSNTYSKDIVTVEYQSGYKFADKCVRPAMVVVSLGPGP